jgi:hypothetical protein
LKRVVVLRQPTEAEDWLRRSRYVKRPRPEPTSEEFLALLKNLR